jgi:hypothetical protein
VDLGDLFVGLLNILIVLILGAAGSLLADEVKSRSGRWAQRITRVAARLLPPSDKSRFLEEWPADINEISGPIPKLLRACGLMIAALTRRVQERRAPHRLLGKLGASWILGLAVRSLPPEYRSRYSEEWTGLLTAAPLTRHQIATAIRLWVAAQKIRRDYSKGSR